MRFSIAACCAGGQLAVVDAGAAAPGRGGAAGAGSDARPGRSRWRRRLEAGSAACAGARAPANERLPTRAVSPASAAVR